MHPGGCESKYFISFTLGVSIKYLKINPGVKKFFIKIINYTPGWECSDQSAPSLHSKFYNSNRWNFESGCQVLFRCSCKPGGASGAGSVGCFCSNSIFAVSSCSLPSTKKMFSTYQHRQKACSPMQRIKSAALDTSPTVAELVELQKLGILSREEIRKIILRPTTPSPSNKKKFLAQRQVFEEQRSEVQHGDAPVPQKRDTSVWFK